MSRNASVIETSRKIEGGVDVGSNSSELVSVQTRRYANGGRKLKFSCYQFTSGRPLQDMHLHTALRLRRLNRNAGSF